MWGDKLVWTPNVPTWSTMCANASDKIFMVANYYGSPVTEYGLFLVPPNGRAVFFVGSRG